MNPQSALLCVIAAIILAAGLALQGGRYQFQYQGAAILRMDRWTGVVEIGSSEGWRVLGK